MPRRLTPKGAQRRRDLMDFAAQTFATDGYHTTSVASIVDGLGVGKGVFYWYFQSKDELLGEILADALRSMRLAQRDAIADEHDPGLAILGVTSHLARVLMLERGKDAGRVAEAAIAFCRQGYVATAASITRRIA